MDDATFEKMKAAQESFHPKAISIPGVHGTSIGLKQVAGKLTGTVAICIHVTQKKSADALPQAERIPPSLESFPTDVIESPPKELCDDPNGWRPMEGGCQIYCNNWYGTLGCFVRDKSTKTVYALTCSHCVDYREGSVYQPNDSKVCNQIGSVINFTQKGDGRDVAISSVGGHGIGWKPDIADIGTPAGAWSGQLHTLLGGSFRVFKRGRTTGKTEGQVSNLNFRGIKDGGQRAMADFNIHPVPPDYTPFAQQGDSGSAVVYIDGQGKIWVIGLLNGQIGSSGTATPINEALNAFAPDKVLEIATTTSAPAPLSETVEGRMEAWLCQSQRGRNYWSKYRQYGDGVFHMFHIIPRLYATWLKVPRDELGKMVYDGMMNPDSKIPATVGGSDTAKVIGTLRDAMATYIGDDLQKACDAVLADIQANVGRSWREAVRDGQPAR